MGIKFVVITQPTSEPVSLAEAREHLRLDTDGDSPDANPDDAIVTALITAARQWCETHTGRTLSPTVYEAALDAWPCERAIVLPMAVPLIEVSSLSYYNQSGIDTIYGLWYASPYAVVGQVTPSYTTQQWPTAQAREDAIRIRYSAGYGGSLAMPGPIRQALLLLVGHLYENREDSTEVALSRIPLGIESLLQPYRIFGDV